MSHESPYNITQTTRLTHNLTLGTTRCLLSTLSMFSYGEQIKTFGNKTLVASTELNQLLIFYKPCSEMIKTKEQSRTNRNKILLKLF